MLIDPDVNPDLRGFPMYDLKHWHEQNLHHPKQLYRRQQPATRAAPHPVRHPDSPVYAAVMIKQANNPAMKRSTVVTMLKDGATISDIPDRRSDYGFDSVQDLQNGTFFAQKGGSISDAHSVIEINGDWGIVACWGGDPFTTPWYPYYLGTFSTDKDVLQNGKDFSRTTYALRSKHCSRKRVQYNYP
jgi:hypothetical protein